MSEQYTLSSLFIYPTDAQLDCSKLMSKFTLKFTLNSNLITIHLTPFIFNNSIGLINVLHYSLDNMQPHD